MAWRTCARKAPTSRCAKSIPAPWGADKPYSTTPLVGQISAHPIHVPMVLLSPSLQPCASKCAPAQRQGLLKKARTGLINSFEREESDHRGYSPRLSQVLAARLKQ